MRRIEQSYMFQSSAAASEFASAWADRWAGPYDGRATAKPEPTLPPPYTHSVSTERWNSCD